MTNITATQVREMNDGQLLNHLHKFPYWSKWEDKEAAKIAEYRLCLIQGNRYIATGNINSFRSFPS